MKHIFDAPRDVVFKAWTEPKYLARWWGPHGFTSPVCELDGRAGGVLRIHMRGLDGAVYPMAGNYKESVRPGRLVFTGAALDQKGELIFEVLNTVMFVEKGGKTLVTIDARVVMATAEADIYLQGMEEGWSQSLERLGEFVKEHLT